MKVCKHCNNQFDLEPKLFANHVRWCKHNPKLISYKKDNGALKKFGDVKQFTVCCDKCNSDFQVNEREHLFPKKSKYYCSRSCANSKVFSDETNKKRSDSNRLASIKLWQNNEYAEKALSKLNTNKYFTSKGEIALRTHFISKYANDDWTFGGRICFNDFSLVRDLFSKKLKVCVEYDGIWHFKDIRNQLDDKNKKDKALEDWCSQNNWRLIRVSESYALSNKDFLNEIEHYVYDTSLSVKLGEEYTSIQFL
jgi:hypothetical protein